jgi:hypothetical protein
MMGTAHLESIVQEMIEDLMKIPFPHSTSIHAIQKENAHATILSSETIYTAITKNIEAAEQCLQDTTTTLLQLLHSC